MLDEIRKSINSNLYERTRSPLYGALVTSWCIWNWKLIYYVITVDKKTTFFERIDCIQTEITSNWTLIYGPIISTILILTVFELIANYAYWLHIFYKTWRANKKVLTEGKQLLTYEQSLKLRNDLRQNEEEYEKLIQEKEEIIKSLNSTINQLNSKESSKEIPKDNAKIVDEVAKLVPNEKDIIIREISEALARPLVKQNIEPLYRTIKAGVNSMTNGNVPQSVIDYFEAKNLIKKVTGKVYGVFDMTESGKKFFNTYILEKDNLFK